MSLHESAMTLTRHLATRHLATALLSLALALFLTAPAGAEAWDPFPRLEPGSRSALKPNLDPQSYRNLESCLENLESAVGARYFAAVVEVAHPQGRLSADPTAATSYTDALADAWQSQLPEDHVLIVMALRNRAVGVHAGSRWRQVGFTNEAISRAVDASSYAPLAQAGRFGDALCQLAHDLDQSLALRIPSSTETGRRESSAPPSSRAPVPHVPTPHAPTPHAPAARPAPTPTAPAVNAEKPPAAQAAEKSSPLGMLFFLGLLAAVVVLVVSRRRRTARARQRASTEMERFRERLDGAADRLLELESQHPLYFTTTDRWTGESLEVDRRCAQAVNRVYLLYSKAHELLQRAQSQIAGGGNWRPAPYEEAWQVLHDEKVRLEAGVPATARDARRLTVPLEEAYDGQAVTLLDDLDTAYAQALEQLDAVAAIEAAFSASSARADSAATEATQACRQRAEFALPTKHLTARMGPALDARQQVLSELADDPKAATKRLDEIATNLEAVARLAIAGNRIAEALRGQTATQLGELRKRVLELRAEGWRLAEPGFDPDLRLDRGERQASLVEKHLLAGEEEQAITEHASLRRGLDELAQMIEASVAARSNVPTELDALAAEAATLRQRLPAARRTLEHLERGHALSAFALASDNLDEIVPVQEELDSWLEHIRKDHREENYLSALEDLATARRLLEEGNALIDEIEKTAEDLDTQKFRANADLKRAVSRRLKLEAEVRGAEPGLADEVRQQFDALGPKLEALQQAADADRPDWRDLSVQAAEIDRDLELLEADVERDREDYRQATSRAEALRGQLQSLEQQVRKEVRDRPHVDRAVRDAGRLIANWQADLATGLGGGRRLLERVHEVESRLEWATGIWRSEFNLIHQATTELRAAEAKLTREDRRSHGQGVIADCRAGRDLLEQARRASQRQAWEEVVTLARNASETIDKEAEQARREALEREERERRRLDDLERRRRSRVAASMAQVAMQAAVTVAASRQASSWSSAGTSSSSFGRRPSGGSSGGSFGGGSSGGGSSSRGTSGGGSWGSSKRGTSGGGGW